MSDHKPFSEYLNESKFVLKLLKAATPIYARHMKIALDSGVTQSFDSIGTEKEKHLKEIMSFVGTLQSYFEDLEKVIKYLSVDKTKIVSLYDETLEADEYYKYHYDNFVIRVMTAIDICGKIGIVVYQLGIPEKRANWHSFAIHANVKGTSPAEKIIAFSNFLDDFRDHRHNKIHQGISLDNRFEKIVFWEGIGKSIGDLSINTPVLEEYNQKQIMEAVAGIEGVISQTAKLSIEFLDAMESRLDEILSE